MGFFDDVMDAVTDTVSTGVKKALDMAEPLVHAFKDKDAREVAGGGGYVYSQYPDGSLIIKQGPNGLHDVKVKNGTKAWKAITAEIGPWIPTVGNSQPASDHDDEVIILDDDPASHNGDLTGVVDRLSDPYEQLEFAVDDIERSLGRLRDNASSGQHKELIDRANSLCDDYPEIVRRLGELGDVPNDEITSYLDQLHSLNNELQDADFTDERERWESNAGERLELLDAIQRTPDADTLEARYGAIVTNAENHFMYAMANAEWESFAIECQSHLMELEAGLGRADGEAGTNPPYYDNEGASDDYPELEGESSITVVSAETDRLMSVTRFVVNGAVTEKTVKDMVDKIIEKAYGNLIEDLTIIGHGNPGNQYIADDVPITFGLNTTQRAELARLKDHFAPKAVVTLEGCQVAAGVDGERLLKELATIWGVTVRGGTAFQRAFPWTEGSGVSAIPTDDGVQIEQEDSILNEFWRNYPNSTTDDDEALQKTNEATGRDLADLPLHDRYMRAKTLISGWTGTDEGEAIISLFRSAPPSDRCELYRLLESHPWEGEFHDGVFTDDDGLANVLTEPQLAELKYLLG